MSIPPAAFRADVGLRWDNENIANSLSSVNPLGTPSDERFSLILYITELAKFVYDTT